MWFGDYSALYLELGRLSPSATRNPSGQFTVYAGFDWRIEKARSILGGKSRALASQLLGATVTSATLSGRIPELQLGFSNGMWLTTFNLSKGQPDWCVSFNSPSTVHLCVERGKLALDRRDS